MKLYRYISNTDKTILEKHINVNSYLAYNSIPHDNMDDHPYLSIPFVNYLKYIMSNELEFLDKVYKTQPKSMNKKDNRLFIPIIEKLIGINRKKLISEKVFKSIPPHKWVEIIYFYMNMIHIQIPYLQTAIQITCNENNYNSNEPMPWKEERVSYYLTDDGAFSGIHNKIIPSDTGNTLQIGHKIHGFFMYSPQYEININFSKYKHTKQNINIHKHVFISNDIPEFDTFVTHPHSNTIKSTRTVHGKKKKHTPKTQRQKE